MPALFCARPACCRPGLLWLAAAAAFGLGTPAAHSAKPAQAAPPDGTPVEVTAEMTGAGVVSSGVVLPPIPPVTGSRLKPVPSWGKPLPYPIIIADRRNNRLIEIAPDKRVIWEFASPNLKVYRGNEDVNFSADGKLAGGQRGRQLRPAHRRLRDARPSPGPTACPTRAATRERC